MLPIIHAVSEDLILAAVSSYLVKITSIAIHVDIECFQSA